MSLYDGVSGGLLLETPELHCLKECPHFVGPYNVQYLEWDNPIHEPPRTGLMLDEKTRLTIDIQK